MHPYGRDLLRSRLTPYVVAGVLLVTRTMTTFAEDVVSIDECRVSVFQRVTLSAERMGVLSHVGVREGDTVSPGEMIVQLKDEVARQTLATATKEADNDIDLRYARKLSELSTLEYSKARELNEEIPGAKSQTEVLRLRLAAQRATLQVEQASHQLELAAMRLREAEVALESYRVRAPMRGVVLQVHRRKGEAVHAGDPIAEVASFEQMRVEGFLPAHLSWRVQQDQLVQVQIIGLQAVPEVNKKSFTGKVTFVDPVINEVSQQVRIWAEIHNPGRVLRDGLMARMDILIDPTPAQQAPSRSSPGFTALP